MRLIDAVRKRTDDSEEYMVKHCCPSDYGTKYEKYNLECYETTCQECWNQEYTEYMGGEEA